jgi:hypothetical protein
MFVHRIVGNMPVVKDVFDRLFIGSDRTIELWVFGI